MKRLYLGFVTIILVFSLTACSDKIESVFKKTADNQSSKLLSDKEFTNMLANPHKYKGDKVEFYARVYLDLEEKNAGGKYFEAHVNVGEDKKVIVIIDDENINEDDIIAVEGTIIDVHVESGSFGGKRAMPIIKAKKVELSDYATAFAPAEKTVDVNLEINQHGYVVELKKIETAKNDTRLYVSIKNNSKQNFYFCKYDASIVAGSKQLEINDNYLADYEELPGIILPGVTAEGILLFPKISQTENLKIIIEGYSGDFNLKFQPYQFTVAL